MPAQFKTLFMLLTLLALPAFAYIDPGPATFFIQIIMAGMVGCLLSVRSIFSHIKGFFVRKKPQPPTE